MVIRVDPRAASHRQLRAVIHAAGDPRQHLERAKQIVPDRTRHAGDLIGSPDDAGAVGGEFECRERRRATLMFRTGREREIGPEAAVFDDGNRLTRCASALSAGVQIDLDAGDAAGVIA